LGLFEFLARGRDGDACVRGGRVEAPRLLRTGVKDQSGDEFARQQHAAHEDCYAEAAMMPPPPDVAGRKQVDLYHGESSSSSARPTHGASVVNWAGLHAG